MKFFFLLLFLLPSFFLSACSQTPKTDKPETSQSLPGTQDALFEQSIREMPGKK